MKEASKPTDTLVLLKHLIDQFSMALADSAWTRDSTHIADEVEYAVWCSGRFTALRVHAHEQTVLADIEWTGVGDTLHDVSRDFWAMYGHMAEQTNFVSRSIDADSIVYYAVAGNMQPGTAHGHVLLFRIKGNRIANVLRQYHATQSHNTEWMDGQPPPQ